MSNTEILSGIVVDWAKPMIDDVANQLIGENESVQRANAWIRKYFPVSENYSVWNDLSFLALPLLNLSVLPFLSAGLQKFGVSDELVPDYARGVAEAMCKEAEEKGHVRLLERYSFTAEDMQRLRDLVNERLPQASENA